MGLGPSLVEVFVVISQALHDVEQHRHFLFLILASEGPDEVGVDHLLPGRICLGVLADHVFEGQEVQSDFEGELEHFLKFEVLVEEVVWLIGMHVTFCGLI